MLSQCDFRFARKPTYGFLFARRVDQLRHFCVAERLFDHVGGLVQAAVQRTQTPPMAFNPQRALGVSTNRVDGVDLVHYIRSLSSETQRGAAVLRREKIAAARVTEIPESEQDNAWSDVPAVELRLTPLWWRTTAAPALAVQAVHDGTTIAVRLSWADGAEDRHAARSESFEDAAAMQLYVGPAEPFLGMGDKTASVDVWFWDADRQRPTATVESMYPHAVADVLPFSETAVASAELDRDGARTGDQPAISLPALASGNQIVPPGNESGGTSLHVGGPGSVTFRLPQSQLVRAHGGWRDGRWTVMMKRPLAATTPEDGVSLKPGQKASVAFAVWDGASGDRNGQKSITIWQDLELEE